MTFDSQQKKSRTRQLIAHACRTLAVGITILLLPTLVLGIEVSLKTLDEVILGELQQITNATVVIQQEQETISIPFEELLSVHSTRNRKKQDKDQPRGAVQLSDSSSFYHSDWQKSVQKNEVLFTESRSVESQLSAPLESIRSWRLPGTCSAEELRFWHDLIESSPLSDLLVIRRRSNGELKPIDGVIEGIETKGVTFRIGEDTLTVEWDRVFGLLFFHSQPTSKEGASVTLSNQSRLQSALVTTDDRSLVLRTASGATLQASLESLSAIDFSSGKILALSELPIVKSSWLPPSNFPKHIDFRPRFNQSFTNQPLQINLSDDRIPGLLQTVTYTEGVAMRSRSELCLKIPPGFRWLKGKVGIDPLTQQTGSAELIVLLDNIVMERLIVDGADAAHLIELPLAGEASERELTLKVEQASNRDIGDNLHFVEARVTK